MRCTYNVMRKNKKHRSRGTCVLVSLVPQIIGARGLYSASREEEDSLHNSQFPQGLNSGIYHETDHNIRNEQRTGTPNRKSCTRIDEETSANGSTWIEKHLVSVRSKEMPVHMERQALIKLSSAFLQPSTHQLLSSACVCPGARG